MKKLILQTTKLFVLFLSLWAISGISLAEDLDGRTAFLTTPGRSVSAALNRAGKERKRVLVFVVNPAKREGGHIKGTMGADETKQIVRDHFLVVIVTNPSEKYIAGVVDDVVSVHPAYVLFEPDGTVLAKGDAAMGAANGVKWAQQLAALP